MYMYAWNTLFGVKHNFLTSCLGRRFENQIFIYFGVGGLSILKFYGVAEVMCERSRKQKLCLENGVAFLFDHPTVNKAKHSVVILKYQPILYCRVSQTYYLFIRWFMGYLSRYLIVTVRENSMLFAPQNM